MRLQTKQIADRLEREAALEEQLLQSQKMESMGQLAAGVAHDFNNLLTIIRGDTSLLESETSLSAEARDSVEQITQSADRATDLTRQLLAFSRKQPLQLRVLNLNAVLNDIGKLLQRLLRENHSLKITANPALPSMKGDGGMIHQIIMNLAVNARDAMPDGGVLEIQTDIKMFQGRLDSPAGKKHEGDFICMTVRDQGLGMSKEVKERIFEPFFTTKGIGKGTGLGLATVYGIVQQHGGWIDCESEPGKGTSFHLYFPIYSRVEHTADAAATPHAVKIFDGKILVVEDDQGVRSLTCRILARHGFSFIEAGNAREALQLWDKNADGIHILLTDIKMPGGLTGFDLARKLLEKKPSLKVILASGYSTEFNENSIKDVHYNIFLDKPFTPEALVQAIDKCLD